MDNFEYMMMKLAEGEGQFNESVPAEQQGGQPQAAPQQQAPQQQVAAIPQQQPMPQEAPQQPSPGVAAAQEMLGPVMQAAMQGDPNAQAIVAKTTGEMAASIEAKAQTGEIPTTPEEQAASGVVPPQPPVAPVAPAVDPASGMPMAKTSSQNVTREDLLALLRMQ